MESAERKKGEENLSREEKYAKIYEINMLRCIFCGLCEEACPKEAIFLTDRKMFFIAKDSLWKNRLLGRFCLAMGAFPVHREAADRAALLHAQSVLEAGEVLVLFPEGTRHDGPEIGDILEGATFLSARVAAPIIPVGLGGTAQAMPVGNKLPRRSKVSLYAGEVIEPPERNEGGRVLRSAIREKTIQLRQALQDCFDRASA